MKPLVLNADELPPWRSANDHGGAPFLLCCDHASPRIPRVLDNLGLESHLLDLHIAYDIGAEAMTRLMAEQLDARAVFSSYSRLVIDMNRGVRFDDACPEVSDDHPIPGNLGLTSAAKRERIDALFAPYHGALAQALTDLRRQWLSPGLVSMHSFTPHMNGRSRPWEVAVMWRHDERVARPLIEALKGHGLTVGENEPYSAFEPSGYSIHAHAGIFGAPHVLIEVRQDLLTKRDGIQHWANLLAETLGPIMVSLAAPRKG